MKLAAFIVVGMLVSCGEKPKPAIPVVPAEPKADAELVEVYQKEVLQDAAILKAVRPHLTTSRTPALELYDTVQQGLVSLGGEPSAKDVDKFSKLIENPDKKELERLRAEKVALDKKTDELEAKAAKERDSRIRAEAERDQARKDKAEADRQADLSKSAAELTKYGTWTIGVGVLAFLFGQYLGIAKWVAATTVGLGIVVATTARPLIDIFGGKNSETILLSTLSIIALNVTAAFGWWLWSKLKRNEATPDNGSV